MAMTVMLRVVSVRAAVSQCDLHTPRVAMRAWPLQHFHAEFA
jgi:hypothetical protein